MFRELSLKDGVILRGDRVVIPHTLRSRAIQAGHDGHQGIVKTKNLLRSKVWFPGIDKQVERTVALCRGCQATVEHNIIEPLEMTELPQGPWENVAIDFKGPISSGEYLLVVIDEYSRFVIVETVQSTKAGPTIMKLEKIFSEFGIPLKVKSDNGPPFQSKEYEDYARYMGCRRQPIQPVYPQANGLVENFNKILQKIMTIAKVERNNWKRGMYTFLRNYRTTPHSTTGVTPAELMFQTRSFRTRLPEISQKPSDESVRETDRKNKEKCKKYAERR